MIIHNYLLFFSFLLCFFYYLNTSAKEALTANFTLYLSAPSFFGLSSFSLLLLPYCKVKNHYLELPYFSAFAGHLTWKNNSLLISDQHWRRADSL
jgi:hypothetical protein